MTIKIIIILMILFPEQKQNEIPEYVYEDVMFQLQWEEYRNWNEGSIQLQEII